MPHKILVIDDARLILNTVERALTKVGYRVEKAQNIQELDAALRFCPFDLLVADVHLQDATVDDVVEKVRRASPGIKLLFMSGSTSGGVFEHFIEKPFSIEELREKVRTLLNEPS
jgi:two-component system nitrogen regulation response regulator GlnG